MRDNTRFVLAIASCITLVLGSAYVNDIITEKEIEKREIQIEDLSSSNQILANDYNNLLVENEELKSTIETFKTNDLVYIGEFNITHYCNEPYAHICGTGNRKTARGNDTVVGKTVAVDSSVIPYGTKLYIEGVGWRYADDRGGGINGNDIDILVDYHDEANSLGTFKRDVWIIVEYS